MQHVPMTFLSPGCQSNGGRRNPTPTIMRAESSSYVKTFYVFYGRLKGI
jgi:hypothetical protein